MYQVIVKGNNLKEFKKAIEDCYKEVVEGILVNGPKVNIEKDLAEHIEEVFEEAVTIEESEPEVVEEETPEVDMNDLDSEGVPWDARIHSSGKTKYKKDQTWTLKRGVTDEDAEKIKSLYRRDNTPVPTPIAMQQNAIVQPAVVVAPVVQAAPPLPTMNSGHSVETFKANFPLILGGLITEGKVNQDYINTLKAYFKVDQIWMISEPQKEEMFNSFVQYGIINKVG